MTRSSDHYDQLLQELAEERVAALNRIARHLEQRIHTLNELRASAHDVAGDQRVALLHRYREVRADALRYRWYLDVQREALGLRPHETVEQYYGVPGPLDG